MIEYAVFGGLASYLFVMDLWLNRWQAMTLTRAASWSVMYVAMSLAFAGYVWAHRGPEDAQLFLTAYLLEKVLSVDNLMVFSAVFAYFGIQPQHRHRILRWGILGAAAMRLVMVAFGTAMLARFNAVMSIAFAALIAYAGYQVFMGVADDSVDHNRRWYTRLLRRWFAVYTGIDRNGQFMLRCHFSDDGGQSKGYWAVTPALLCLVAIEVSDIVFAVDSVPVVIAVARDPYIVYTSMIFAILGLRAMYFILDALQRMLRYMNIAVAAVLFFVASKLIFSTMGHHVSPFRSLAVVLSFLAAGVVGSLFVRKPREA